MQTVLLPIPIALQSCLPELLKDSGSINSRQQLLLLLISLVALVGILRATANYYFLKLAGIVGHELVARLRGVAFAHFLRLPVGYVESRGSGRVLLRFISDADALRSWVSKAGPRLVADSITAILIVLALLWLNPYLSLALALPLLAWGLVLWRLSKPLRESTRLARGLQARLTGEIEHRLSNLREAKLCEARSKSLREIELRIREVATQNAERDRLAAVLETWGQLSIFIALPLLLFAGFSMVWQQQLEATSFVTIVWLALHLIVLLRNSLAAFVLQQKALVSTQRLFVLLCRAAEKGRGQDCIKPKFRQLRISVKEKSYVFGIGLHTLPAEIDLDICKDVLLGFRKTRKLQIAIDGLKLEKTDVKFRRRRVGTLDVSALQSGIELNSSGLMSNGFQAEGIEKLRVIFLKHSQANMPLPPSLITRIRKQAGSAIILCEGTSKAMESEPKPQLI